MIRDFSRAKDVPLFILCVGAGMTLAPIFSLPGYYLSGLKDFATDPSHWVRWWGNAVAGALLLRSHLDGLQPQEFRALHRALGRRRTVACSALLVCCASIMLAPGALGRPLIVVFAFILVVVSAMRFGLVLAAGASFVISTMTAVSAAFSIGAFAQFNQLQGLVTIWSFIASLVGLEHHHHRAARRARLGRHRGAARRAALRANLQRQPAASVGACQGQP